MPTNVETWIEVLDGSECPRCGKPLEIVSVWLNDHWQVVGSQCAARCGFTEREEADHADAE